MPPYNVFCIFQTVIILHIILVYNAETIIPTFCWYYSLRYNACPVSSKIALRLSQTSVYTELSRKSSKFDTLNSPEHTEFLHHISLLPQICNNFVFLDLVKGTSKLSFDAIILVG